MAKPASSTWIKFCVVTGIIAIAAYAFVAYRGKNDSVVEYQTVVVTRGELLQVVNASGTLNPVIKVDVGSQISGIIQRLYADFNSVVTNGQVIAQLDPATYRANVNSAEGELANAAAGLELAQINARRAAQLLKYKLISESESDTAQASLHQAEAQVKIRSATLERARVDFSRCTIYAPVDGIVIDRKVDVGQTVAASLSAPVLFQIANDLSKMQINAAVAEADIGGITPEQDVDFTVDAFPSRTFKGRVTQVRNAPIITQNVVTYDTIIEVNNKDLKLKPGMTATVSIIIARRDKALKLLNTALRFKPVETVRATGSTNAIAGASSTNRSSGEGRGGDSRGLGTRRPERVPVRTVYLHPAKTDTGKSPELKPVQIKTGITDGFYTEVTDGLTEGDIAVVGLQQPQSSPTTMPSSPFGSPSFRRF
jgi:HlyD family secretion protein